MKKLVGLVVLSLFVSGSVFAATITRNASDFLTNCSDPSSGGCNFQVDINGNLTALTLTSNGSLTAASIVSTGLFTPQSATSAVINALAPTASGQFIFCNNCGNFNANQGTLCMSTGTVAGSFVAVASGTAVTACR